MITENTNLIEKTIEVLNSISNRYESIEFGDNTYELEGNEVPRVTAILSAMLHEDYLMKWSNSLGFKRQSYTAYMKEAADKGTYTHSSIEYFLKERIDPDFEQIPYLARTTVNNAYSSFKSWWNCITKSNQIELIASEKRLICKYFGGTLDCLLRINGKIWLIDFKTSNHMNYKYYLQLAAYAYMLEEIEGIKIDGCLVLKLNKYEIRYDEFVLDLNNNKKHQSFFENCKQEFLALTMAYYGRVNIESEYKNIIKG